MSQIFHPSMNTVSRVTIFGGVFILIGLGLIVYYVTRSSYVTEVDVPLEQPVPFSHQHHVGHTGIDCRYCHTAVEVAPSAGMPSTETCMTCHSQLWTDAEVLEPVRESYRTGQPIEWNRVHDLADFAYFNHSIHVQKGVGCETCHGPVNEMPLTWKEETLFMEWCLECHRHPDNYIRPVEEIFTLGWEPPTDQLAFSDELITNYEIEATPLDDCSVCHQ